MEAIFREKLIINGDELLKAVRKFCETQGSLIDINEVPQQVINHCIDLEDVVSDFLKSLKGE